jgi:hypothetical protein
MRNTIVAAWSNKKDAPVALDIARSILVADMKASAQRGTGQSTMNVQIVQMSAPMPNFPRKRIEE